ncbi:MAG: PEP/pyruvate-binding domain-containing protein [Candidatus Bipolaricaulota bacterium]
MLKGLLRMFGGGGKDTVERLRERLGHFRELVQKNDQVLTLMAEAGEKLGGEYLFDRKYLRDLADELRDTVRGIVQDLAAVSDNRYPELLGSLADIDAGVEAAMELRTPIPDAPLVLSLETVGLEHADAVGEKMARLGEVRNRLGLPVPDGFVVSTRACWEFLEKAGAAEDAEALRTPLGKQPGPIPPDAEGIRRKILEGDLPGAVTRAIRQQVKRMVEMDESVLFAVRSSAVGEDGELITAGQFTTLLGVPPGEVCTAYKQVVASLFDPEVLTYQGQHGVPPGQGMMAVGCLAMVPSRSSGVVYSLDPLRPERDVQLVAASWGLGKIVVEGDAPVDRFAVGRAPERPVLFRRIADKTRRYVLVPGGGMAEEPVSEEEGKAPCVSDGELRAVTEAACRIERHMKCAQDVEWALDPLGRLTILQARPLRIQPSTAAVDRDLSQVMGRYPVLMQGKGEVACRGIGSGRVRLVDSGSPLPGDGSRDMVLVARSASPRLGARLSEACAVITDVGNATGHFAAVAREARVPTIVDTGVATSMLEEGQEVTVDAEENVVYLGRVEELLHYQLLKSTSFEDAPEFRALRRMLRRIAPLNLSDPQSRDFASDRCRTYHDVIRFAHEKAVAALTELEWIRPSAEVEYVRRLLLPIPLDLVLVDLGGGVQAPPEEKRVGMEAVESRPLRPLLEVLCGKGGWETSPADMDLDGFMSSATRALPLATPITARPEQNLAIISREYLHLSLRLGYHFNVVDAFLTDRANDNYIYFRFLGGVTEATRRSRRATLLRRILESYGFVVEGRGDLVIGRTRGLRPEVMVERMRMVGRLIGYSRQLDIYLRDDDRIDEYLERFLNGDSTLTGA